MVPHGMESLLALALASPELAADRVAAALAQTQDVASAAALLGLGYAELMRVLIVIDQRLQGDLDEFGVTVGTADT